MSRRRAFKTPEEFTFYQDQRAEDARIKLEEMQGFLNCPPHRFAWRNDGKAECVKCGYIAQ